MGYVDYAANERPNESSVFFHGRSCREVHILIEEVQGEDLLSEGLCQRLFAKKEERLQRFYAPCASGGDPDLTALQVGRAQPLGSIPGAVQRMVGGAMVVAFIEVMGMYLWWCWGTAPTFIGLCCCCAAFVAIGTATGGLDSLLLRRVDCGSASDAVQAADRKED